MRQRLHYWAGSLCCLLSVMLVVAADSAGDVYVTPEAAAVDPDFALQGEYRGQAVGVQIVALGKGAFQAVVYRGGLPGAGWNGTEKQETDEDTAAVQSLIKDLQLKKVERKSPTLGAAAPAGAVVLFDGQAAALKQHWQAGTKVEHQLLLPGSTTTDQFTDFTLHLEFRLPYMPTARGQGRGNSGVYFQGRYEVQILDSFGLAGKDDECGGLYQIKAPDLNLCLPPLSWQTYDIDFTAARWAPDGKKLANARATIRHNGIVIQQDVELPNATRAAPQSEGPAAGPLYLQDHGNPVRFRNIWLLPRNAEQEAKRPLVPGFERFYGATGSDAVAGGRLLLGELNCVACHQAEEATTRHLTSRPAPNLEQLGKRVHADYLLKYLENPHAAKPGTLMPDLLTSWPAKERAAAVLALTNFLVGTATVPQQIVEPQAAQRGQKLFKEIGCLACHADPHEPPATTSTVVPLGDLPAKYSISSLAEFLQAPHLSRPAGRMPNLMHDKKDAVDVASYLVGHVDLKPKRPNLRFAAYHGDWNNVPKFEDLQPVKHGECAGFDLAVAGRPHQFGMRFEGFLKIDQPGEYSFHLGSDDGSLLFIDGKKAVVTDGVHPYEVHTGKEVLTKGMHAIRVDYTQGGGEAELTLEYEGPGTPRQDINRALSLTEAGPPPEIASDTPGFQFDPELVEKGRSLFQSIGCASCHQFKEQGQLVQSLVKAPALKDLNPTQGCLADQAVGRAPATETGDALGKAVAPVPQFDLNTNQRAALATALVSALTRPEPHETLSPAGLIGQTMTAFNCYGCHSRAGIGGPPRERNAVFLSTIPEMGDEGRVPPPLDGVGDKLTAQWLQHVLQEGAKDRPYMLTRMPKFGLPRLNDLAAAFIAADRHEGPAAVKLPEAEHRVKAVGRQLVGDKALGCIKCHTFGTHRASGIQAINLQTMTQRIREDWFLRYMINPIAFRPGTRMPTGFPEGKATIRDVYQGNTDQQLAAIWTYLKDGSQAGLPEGLIGNVIELKPVGKPIIYRNFLEGLTPRGIAVGYPERGHLAWDANTMSLTLIWHGRFIDAGKHWEGRGAGNQGPLGDHVMRLEETVPLAVLDSPAQEWPKTPPREAGYRFRGYEIDADGRPHFRYTAPQFEVRDFPKPVATGADPGFERRLTIQAGETLKTLYFRAGTAAKIEEEADGWFVLDGTIRIRIPGTKPIVRTSGGKQELLVSVPLTNGKGEMTQEIQW